MLQLVLWTPHVGSAVTLNTVDGSGHHRYPLHQFDIVALTDQPQPAKRMAYPGEWPKFHYPAAQTIHAEGQILGAGASDALRSQDYISQRIALLDALTPPVQVLTARTHGTLRIQFDGAAEAAEVECACVARQIPMQALHPANSSFMIQWKAFEPYFTGVSTATKYYYG